MVAFVVWGARLASQPLPLKNRWGPMHAGREPRWAVPIEVVKPECKTRIRPLRPDREAEERRMVFLSPRGATAITTALHSSSPFPTPPPPYLFVFAASFSALLLLKNSIFPSLPSPTRLRLPKPAKMNKPHPTIAFSSPESLSQWLGPRLPPGALASWGAAPGTKSLHNLWLELSQGESSLLPPANPSPLLEHHEDQAPAGDSPPPVRAVHVATLKIRNARGALLVESHQLLSNGAVRARNRPLSEKMRPGESVDEAVARAVREELGDVVAVRILPGSYEMRVEDGDSVSYPGLPARYVLHSMEAQVVEGLPEDEEFSTEETGEYAEAEERAVVVKRHFWRWVEDDGCVPHAQA